MDATMDGPPPRTTTSAPDHGADRDTAGTRSPHRTEGCMEIARRREAERVRAMTPRERVLLALSLAHRLDAWRRPR
jgi:hypothetical protein